MSRTYLRALILFLFLSLPACTLNSAIIASGGQSSSETERSPINETPETTPSTVVAPTALLLITPTSSPSSNTTPTFRISDLIAGDVVKLYSDSVCLNEIASGTASSTTLDITVNALTTGSHSIRAKIQRNEGNSNCSEPLFTYVVAASTSCGTYSGTVLGNVSASQAGMAGQSVYVVGDYAYMGTSAGSGNTGIQIVDVSNPSAPTNISYIPTYTGSGQIDVGANDILDIVVVNDMLFASTLQGGLLIVDVSNKSTPAIRSTLNFTGETWSISVKNNYVYVGSTTAGLYVVDVSNPNSPSLVNTVATMPLRHIQIIDNKIYGSANTKIQVIDISTPSTPSLLGELTIGLNAAYETFYKNGYLYALEKSARNLLTYDVSNPSAITLVNTLAVPGAMDPRSIDGTEDKIFVGTGSGSTGEIKTYSISTPSAPSLLGSLSATQRAYEIDFSGGYVYSSNLDGKLQVFQVCAP